MKRTYEKPVLAKRDQLATITASSKKVSPFEKDKDYDYSAS